MTKISKLKSSRISKRLDFLYKKIRSYSYANLQLTKRDKRNIKICIFASLSVFMAPYILSHVTPGLKSTVYAMAAEKSTDTAKKLVKKGKEETVNSLASGRTDRALTIGITTLVGGSIVGFIIYLKTHPNALNYGWMRGK